MTSRLWRLADFVYVLSSPFRGPVLVFNRYEQVQIQERSVSRSDQQPSRSHSSVILLDACLASNKALIVTRSATIAKVEQILIDKGLGSRVMLIMCSVPVLLKTAFKFGVQRFDRRNSLRSRLLASFTRLVHSPGEPLQVFLGCHA